MLLDTHALLWLLTDDARLGPSARRLLDRAADRWVSTVSLWEIAIKVDLGKLTAPDDLPARVTGAGLEWLDLRPGPAWSVRAVAGLPHRDPFDRLLLAQAHDAGVPFLTADEQILAADLSPAVDLVDARR